MEQVVHALVTGDPIAHQKASEHYEKLKNLPGGWREGVAQLLGVINLDHRISFLYLNIVDYFVRTRYVAATEQEQADLRTFVTQWIAQAGNNSTVSRRDPAFVVNKFAQVVTQIVLIDYPLRWPTFFVDLMSVTRQPAWDLYLKILVAVNEEIAGRELSHSPKDLARDTLIKDTMRETCVPALVNSFYDILVTCGCDHSVYVQCLNAIGAYVAWIDLRLVVNDQMMSVVRTYLADSERPPEVREAAVACLCDVVHKGMDPTAKIDLVSNLLDMLHITFESFLASTELSSADVDIAVELSKLLNCMITSVLASYQRLVPKKQVSEATAEQAAFTHSAINLLEEKLMPLCEKCLAHADDNVSDGVTEAVREFLQHVKKRQLVSDRQRDIIYRLLVVVFRKYSFDEDMVPLGGSTMIENGCSSSRETDDEAEFFEYRRSLKVIFDNIAQIEHELVLSAVAELIHSTFASTRKSHPPDFAEIERSVAFLFLLGEALSPSVQQQHQQRIAGMLNTIVVNNVASHPHAAVRVRYFETVARFDRLLTTDTLPLVIGAFLDERGLRSSNSHVASRCSYLFSKLIKSSRNRLEGYVDEILARLHDLLLLPQFFSTGEDCVITVTGSNRQSTPVTPSQGVLPQQGHRASGRMSNGIHHVRQQNRQHLSPDDQLYLYEATAALIVSSDQSERPVGRKEQLLRQLLAPLMETFSFCFNHLLQRQQQQPEPTTNESDAFESVYQMASAMSHAIALTTRTSKAFSNNLSMRTHHLVSIYTDAIRIFGRAVELSSVLPVAHGGHVATTGNDSDSRLCGIPGVHSALRQFLHRMVVCLDEEELMPFMPQLISGLLGFGDGRLILSDSVNGVEALVATGCSGHLWERFHILQETIPLVNQLVTKFKKGTIPLLRKLFLPIVTLIFSCINVPVEASDLSTRREKQMLHRAYFALIQAMVSSDIFSEILSYHPVDRQEQVYKTLVEGAVHSHDPAAQKICFTIFRRMVTAQAAHDIDCSGSNATFLFNGILLACFEAPLQRSFDLEDAQTILVLTECAHCLQGIYQAKSAQCLHAVSNEIFPRLQLDAAHFHFFQQHIQQEFKIFRSYLKGLFEHLRSRETS